MNILRLRTHFNKNVAVAYRSRGIC